MRIARLAIAAAFIAMPQVASADPLLLTGGSLAIYWDGYQSSFGLSSPTFSAGASANGPGAFFGFDVGHTVDLDPVYSFSPSTAGENGSFAIDGMHDGAFIFATFDIDTAPFFVGDFPGRHVFTTPFTLTGAVRGFATNSTLGSPLFVRDVVGSGVLTIRMDRISPTTYLHRESLVYDIVDPAAAATPEPASLALLGSGLVGMIAAGRRRGWMRRAH